MLGLLIPRYVEGLPALRPLLPGMVCLGLAWPARQLLIALSRPYRLCLATGLGLGITATSGAIGADQAGMVGVAWGMSIGYAAVTVLTSATALGLELGWGPWLRHLVRVLGMGAYFAAGAVSLDALPGPLAVRGLVVVLWLGGSLLGWLRWQGWTTARLIGSLARRGSG